MRKRTRKTNGARRAAALALVLVLAAAGADGRKKKASSDSYAVVAGTVFRDPGFALPGAEITLTCTSPPEGVKSVKPLKFRSDARGEFGFRVPPGKASYSVTVKAAGFASDTKRVEVAGDERVDVYFSLKPSAP